MASAGDVNGDGFADLIVGALYADPHGTDSGASYVVFGKASGFAANLDLSSLDGSNGFKLSGAAAGDYSGWSVASAGDVNGDGFADLIVGAPDADPTASIPARAMWCSARPRALPPTSICRASTAATASSSAAWRRMTSSGRSVASAGDVNGDGFADLIVGAIGADPHGSRFGRELCGVRQGLGLCRQPRPVEPRRQQRLQAQRRGGG